jgi:hypothetical protein
MYVSHFTFRSQITTQDQIAETLDLLGYLQWK